MRKSHFILLAATAVLALSSAYSLAAINQVYNIGFEWYSQLESSYKGVARNIADDRQLMAAKDIDLKLYIVDGIDKLKAASEDAGDTSAAMDEASLEEYVYICCMLGRSDSPEFRIKAADIAQRGSNLEIKLSINTPEPPATAVMNGQGHYRPVDIIKIKKSAFPTKGRLLAIFKNQDGIPLGEQYFYVK